MIYLLIKVCVNKDLIRIKCISKTLKISYYNGKDKVCLCGGIGFKSCLMHVNIYFNILFIYLYVLKLGYIILCFSRSVRITLRHRKVVYSNSILLIPLPPLSRRVHQRCRGIPHGCVEMGQDHRGLEPRNQGSEGKDSEGHVGTETVGRQRRVGGERESRALLARHGHAQSGTRRATLVK